MIRPSQIGKYHIIGELARGGMGVVYLVAARGPGDFSKLLVLKELKGELAEDPALIEMFFEEARLAARLNHPNIVQTYEIGTDGARHFIVMDYLSGRALSRVLRRRDKAFTRAMHLRVLCEILQALDYAHKLKGFDGKEIGIVHRDVNPQNVFITFDGQVKLLDFGIAKSLDSHVETLTGVLKGKPGYMAPEQIKGGIDGRTDIYAVGTMIWEAVAGRPLWAGKADIVILTHLMEGKIPSLTAAVPDAPPALVRICEKAMARNPEARHATAAELQAELQAYLAAEPDAPTMKDVAAVVARIFAEDHARTRSAIDTCLAALRAGESEIIPAPLSANMHDPTPSGANPYVEPTPSANVPPPPRATDIVEATIEAPPAPWRGRLLVALMGGILLLLALIGLGLSRSAEPSRDVSPVDAIVLPVTQPVTAAPAKPPAAPAKPPAAPDVPPPATAAKPPVSILVNPASRQAQAGAGAIQGLRPTATATAAPSAGAGAIQGLRPTATATAAPPPPPPSMCNPPFYFEGTKKIYKPGCI